MTESVCASEMNPEDMLKLYTAIKCFLWGYLKNVLKLLLSLKSLYYCSMHKKFIIEKKIAAVIARTILQKYDSNILNFTD